MNTYPIAGKTGTADVAAGKEPNAWFVGFGPTNHAPNQPEYVVAVVVDHGGYGAQAAAPAVAQIFNYLYANPVGPVQIPTSTNPPSSDSTIHGARRRVGHHNDHHGAQRDDHDRIEAGSTST